ncbi:MAG: hypothetical protein DCF20_13080 [Pseudanabaena sp.]|nr:MAG: hypothetical protein DCF20_13080 [Pseudanabaena sp.]
MIRCDRPLQILPTAEMQFKERELQTIWKNPQYVINGQLPLGDATLGMVDSATFLWYHRIKPKE